MAGPLSDWQNSIVDGIQEYLGHAEVIKPGIIGLAICGSWGVGKSHVARALISKMNGEVMDCTTTDIEQIKDLATTQGSILLDNMNYLADEHIIPLFQALISFLGSEATDGQRSRYLVCSVNLDHLLDKMMSPAVGMSRPTAQNLFNRVFGQLFYLTATNPAVAVETFWPQKKWVETRPLWLPERMVSGQRKTIKDISEDITLQPFPYLVREYLVQLEEVNLHLVKNLCLSFAAFVPVHGRRGLDHLAEEGTIKVGFPDTAAFWVTQAAFIMLIHIRQVEPDIYQEWVYRKEALSVLKQALVQLDEIVATLPHGKRIPPKTVDRLERLAEWLESLLFPETAAGLRGDRRLLQFWRRYSGALSLAGVEMGRKWPQGWSWNLRDSLQSSVFFEYVEGILAQ